MTQATSTEWEVTIVLPLGAVANQLQKIEAQLRLLNMKALNFARERDGQALHGLVEARLEQIRETLLSVTALVSDIEADLSPSRTKVTRLSLEEETISLRADPSVEDMRASRNTTRQSNSARKPYPDRDD